MAAQISHGEFLAKKEAVHTTYSSVSLCRAHCPSPAADGKPALHSLLCEVLSTPALQMLIATAPLCPPFKWGDKKKVCHKDHRDTKDEGRIKKPREFVRWITMSRGKESLGHKEPSCGRVREPPLWQRAAARGEEEWPGALCAGGGAARAPPRAGLGHGRACSAPARPLPAAGTVAGVAGVC